MQAISTFCFKKIWELSDKVQTLKKNYSFETWKLKAKVALSYKHALVQKNEIPDRKIII
jgi:hypothetical protein